MSADCNTFWHVRSAVGQIPLNPSQFSRETRCEYLKCAFPCFTKHASYLSNRCTVDYNRYLTNRISCSYHVNGEIFNRSYVIVVRKWYFSFQCFPIYEGALLWSLGRMIQTGESWSRRRQPVPVPLCPPHLTGTGPRSNPGLCGDWPHGRSCFISSFIRLARS